MILYEQIDVDRGETSVAINKVQKAEGEEKSALADLIKRDLYIGDIAGIQELYE